MKIDRVLCMTGILSIYLTGCEITDHTEQNGSNHAQQAQMNEARVRVLSEEDLHVDRTLRVSQLAEQYVENLDEIEGAHVIFSNNNAYVAVRLANQNNQTKKEITKESATALKEYGSGLSVFEQKITDQVRKADNKIHKVYISVNPDFYTTMHTYADDIRSDRNKSSLYRDFSNTVTNFFGIEK